MRDKTFHVFGDGLYAATLVKLLRDNGFRVFNYRLSGLMGGSMASTFINNYENPIYGPHYLHTNNPDVVDVLNSVCEFIESEEDTKTCIRLHGEYRLINGDLNHASVMEAFDISNSSRSTFDYITRLSASYNLEGLSEQEVTLLKIYGAPMYHACIKNQTEKTWNRPISEVPLNIIKRVKLNDSLSKYKYSKKYNLYPKRGWCSYFNNILYDSVVIEKDQLVSIINYLNDRDSNIVYSLPITLLDPTTNIKYITRKFEQVRPDSDEYKKLMNIPNFKDYCSIYAAYDPEVIRYIIPSNTPANRYWGHNPESPLIIKELFKEAECNDPYFYLDPDPENVKNLNNLKNKFKAKYPKMIFGGRLGKGSYTNMDGIIESCIDQLELWK